MSIGVVVDELQMIACALDCMLLKKRRVEARCCLISRHLIGGGIKVEPVLAIKTAQVTSQTTFHGALMGSIEGIRRLLGNFRSLKSTKGLVKNLLELQRCLGDALVSWSL